MRAFDFGYRTSSGNEMVLSATIASFPREEIPVVDIENVGEACGDCKGWNGGCPGCSPYFLMLKKSLPYVTVLLLSIDMAWPTMYSRGGRNPVSANLFRMGYADRLTDRFVWKILNGVHDHRSRYALGCGHCPTCPKKKCGPIKYEKCHRPLDRRFSMESTGVDCDALMQKVVGRKLSWWFKDEFLPQYMTRVASVVNSTPDEIEALLEQKIFGHKHTVAIGEITTQKIQLRTAMHVAHTGVEFPVYTDLNLGYRDV